MTFKKYRRLKKSTDRPRFSDCTFLLSEIAPLRIFNQVPNGIGEMSRLVGANGAVMHTLEYLLCVLSRRIELETGNKELADAALTLASASHAYLPEGGESGLEAMHAEWHRRYGKLMHGE